MASMLSGPIYGQPVVIPLGDDDFAEVALPFAFPFCGHEYNSVFVGSNGFLTLGAGDTDFSESVADLLDPPPRIAPMWDDLNPGAGGTVTAEDFGTDFVVIWDGVPEFFNTGSNTFSVTLRPDGSFDFDYGAVAATGGLVGVSPGLGAFTGDPGEIDVSAAAQPIGGAPGDAVYELFSAGDNDLSGAHLEWASCPDFEIVIAPAEAGVCYGSTGAGTGGLFLTIDLLSGAATVVGPTGLSGVPGLAINSSGEIFGTERISGDLYRIDAVTGSVLFVASTGVPFLDGIAFDENDVLYGVGFDPPAFTLLSIDTSSGATTRVGPRSDVITGLAFDPTDGQLYGSLGGFNPINPDGIFQIDKTSGASVVLGATGLGGATPDLMFDASGNMFGVKGGGGSPNNLISVDKITGAGLIVGPTGVRAVSGLACARLDTDGDGVLDDVDLCPGTAIPEATVPSRTLRTNRWALVDDDLDFDTIAPRGEGPRRSYSTEDTGGCSCEQIIEELDLGKGHSKFGCSISAMDDWVGLVNS